MIRRAIHSSHQFFGEVTNQITNFKSPLFLFQVIKMCCMIQLWLRVRNFYRNWIIQHILVTWNRKIGDLKLVTWLVTSPKNWWLEWTARLKRIALVSVTCSFKFHWMQYETGIYTLFISITLSVRESLVKPTAFWTLWTDRLIDYKQTTCCSSRLEDEVKCKWYANVINDIVIFPPLAIRRIHSKDMYRSMHERPRRWPYLETTIVKSCNKLIW